MTYITHPTCDNIILESTYLDPANISVSLAVTFNCDTEYAITVPPEDADITVDPTALGLDQDALTDGVYYLKLTVVQDDSTVVEESVCVLVNCSMTCQMLDVFTAMSTGDTENTIAALSYYALVTAAGCTSCACSDLCTLYEATQLIECDSNVTTCGCS
jgi:hypothetical protein